MPIEALTAILDRVAPRCEITWPINDGQDVTQCRRKPTTWCRPCGKEICHDHCEVVALEPCCPPCAGIKKAEIEQLLREAAKS